MYIIRGVSLFYLHRKTRRLSYAPYGWWGYYLNHSIFNPFFGYTFFDNVHYPRHLFLCFFALIPRFEHNEDGAIVRVGAAIKDIKTG